MNGVEELTRGSARIYEGRLFSVRVDDVELSNGRRTRREIVEHPGAVGILAWDGERLAMVRQWRQPARRVMLEIPAGTLDPDEAPPTTAQRELREETGLEARRWEPGPRFFTAVGFCTEELALYLATDLTDAGRLAAEDEEIELEWLPLNDALAAIEAGGVADAKSIIGIYWLARQLAR
jgi:ADP-ribose pyrophosphatase